MGKLIIDNSVWFSLGRGIQNDNIKFIKKIEMSKVLSGVNIAEIILSEGYFEKTKDLNERLNLIKACIKYSDERIFDDPLCYLLGVYDDESRKDYTSYYNDLCEIYSSTYNRKMIPQRLPNHNDEQLKLKKLEASRKKEEMTAFIIEPLNKSITEILRKKIDFKKEVKEEIVFNHFKNQIIEFFQEFASLGKKSRGWEQDKLYQIDEKRSELILEVTTLSFIDRLKSRKLYTKNDIYDILQLAYVVPGDLFWTKEKQWIEIIESKESLKKYLFRK